MLNKFLLSKYLWFEKNQGNKVLLKVYLKLAD